MARNMRGNEYIGLTPRKTTSVYEVEAKGAFHSMNKSPRANVRLHKG